MRRLATFVVALAFAWAAPAALGEGVPVLTPSGVVHRAQPAGPAYHPFLPTNPSATARGKQLAELRAAFANPLAPMQSPSLDASVVGSLNQGGLSAGDNAARNDGTPPDPTGAVGPSNYVEFVNSVVGVYDKATLGSGSPSATAQLDTFAGHTNDAVFDPQIQWDQQGQRWLYLADDCAAADCSTTNYLAYGFSKSTDPSNLSSGWCNYFVRVDNAGGTGLFDDYPKLGHNDSHLIFGTNVFKGANFVSARIWTLPKPAAGTLTSCPAAATADYWSGSAASPSEDQTLISHKLTTSDGTPAGTPVPADTANASTNGYVVAADDPNPAGSQIMVWHVNGSGSLVADGNINVSSYAVPAPVAQPPPATINTLDSSDARLTQAVALGDPDAGGAEAVWTQHTINGTGGLSVDRWYELIPSSLTRRQEGNVSNSTAWVFNGAISPTGAGNEAVIQYNVGGATIAPQLRASSRVSGDPLGSMGSETTLGSNSNVDQDFSCPTSDPVNNPSCRWGDYAGATPDPSSLHRVWGTNQLNGPPSADSPAWITRNFALQPGVAPTVSLSVSPNPGYTGKTITFNASASDPDGGSIASYEWDFGSGSFGGPDSPSTTHAYATPGTYTVRVRVTDADDHLSSIATQRLTIQSNAPNAAFSVSPSSATRGQNVTFDGSASNDPDGGGIATYAWTFGDGTSTTTTTPIVTHEYGGLGTFQPTLVVTDADDGSSSARASQSVSVVNSPPLARLSFSPAAPGADSKVTFSAAASSDGDGSIADYRWDLNGDGSFEADTGATPTVSQTFKRSGTFEVGVEVRDNDGATATTAATVRVSAFTLTLAFPHKVRFATLARRGLKGKTGCGRRCTVTLTLRIPAKLARRLHTRTVVASVRVRERGSSAVRSRVRLRPSARRALARARTATLTLSAFAVDTARNRVSRRSRIALRR